MSSTSQARPRRREPRQQRSRESVRKIQQASLDLLADEGLEGLTTNAIAERAGVNIATLYSYFPDKYSILYDLFDTFETERSDYVQEHVADLVEAQEWAPWLARVIDRMAQFRHDNPAGVVLRRALLTIPELRELDERSTAQSAQAIADAFCRLRPSLDTQHIRLVAAVAVESITHLLDSAFASTPPDTARIEELKAMMERYLAPHLD